MPPPYYRSRRKRRKRNPHADRIVRALRQRLRLLHRSGPTFFILGHTGNVYTVTLSSNPTCTCPDPTTPCKHIYFVLIQVLNVPFEDSVLRRRTYFPCQLQRLLSEPTSSDWLAGETVRLRFFQLFFAGGEVSSDIVTEEGAVCPICLDEMVKEQKLVACGTCRNPVHEECFVTWRRSGAGSGVSKCVMCRARWKDKAEQDGYLNLAEYLSDEDDSEEEEDSENSDDSDSSVDSENFLLLTSGQVQGGFDLTLRTGCHFGDSNTRLR